MNKNEDKAANPHTPAKNEHKQSTKQVKIEIQTTERKRRDLETLIKEIEIIKKKK